MRGDILEKSVRMMKVPPLSLVGMERLPLPLPFSPELLWRYNTMGPNPHSGQLPASSPAAAAAAAAAAAGALSNSIRAAAAASASLPYPLSAQLPFAYDIKHTIPIALASDPRLWSRDDVLTFLQWCEREFDLPSFDTDRFQMNGKALCLLTKADLELRAPCSGDVIHNALQLLMNSSSESPLTPQTPSLRMPSMPYKGPWSMTDLHYQAAQQNGTTSVTLSPAPSLDGGQGSPPEHAPGAGGNHLSSSASSSGSGGNNSDSEYDSVGESPERSPLTQSHSPPPLPQPQQLNNLVIGYPNGPNPNPNNTTTTNGRGDREGSNGVTTTSSGQSSPSTTTTTKSSSHGAKNGHNGSSPTDGGEYNNNGRLLWDFLQQLLNDPSQRYSSFIAWKNVETGIFKIVDPPGLARLWGIQKNHLSMNYDKMSRALRYYYRVNILRKVQGERHCYQFLRNPGELKSIKNISMLRHSATSSVNGGKSSNETLSSSSFQDDGDEGDYVDDDMPTDLSMDSERHLKREDSPTDLSMDSSERHHYTNNSIKEEGDYYANNNQGGIKDEDD